MFGYQTQGATIVSNFTPRNNKKGTPMKGGYVSAVDRAQSPQKH